MTPWPWRPEAARNEGGFAAMRCKVTGRGAARRLPDRPAKRSLGSPLARCCSVSRRDYRVKSPAEGGPAPGSEIVETLDATRFDKPADWRRKPSPQDLLVVWPKKAWAKGVGGKATIQCPVSAQGCAL